MPPELWVCHLGTIDYIEALGLQERLRAARQQEELPDVLLMLEHWPVYTRGRRSGPGELPMGEDWYRMQGIDTIQTDRGGKVTYHGPGQLVGYPILDLGVRPDAAAHLRRMEEVVIRAAGDLGIELHRREDVQTGVWSGDRKVCAIGVRLMRARVTLHGFAVNCDTDLSWFRGIVACGLPDHGVTSLSELAGRVVTVEEFRPLIRSHVAEVFGLDLRPAAPDAVAAFQASAISA
jgi:lipoyl(octanoyl) transferase